MKKYALFPLLLLAGGVVKAQPPASVLQTESRVVLVDSVVTDKKGNYLRDLTEKNFRVFEDEKEQTLTSFSFEGGQAASAKRQVHYMVLFFDNSGLEPAEQPRVRREALKFVEANNVSENRMIAVVNYGGSMQVAQNFTNDTELLRNAINGVKSGGSPEKGLEGATKLLAEAASDLTARSMLLALRNLARGMSRVPGRKTVVLLSPGFKFRSEDQGPGTGMRALAECSRANVVDLRAGCSRLIAGVPSGILPASLTASPSFPAQYRLQSRAPEFRAVDVLLFSKPAGRGSSSENLSPYCGRPAGRVTVITGGMVGSQNAGSYHGPWYAQFRDWSGSTAGPFQRVRRLFDQEHQ